MEDDNELIPAPSRFDKLKLESNQIAALFEVWMPLYRPQIKTVYVKKTLTLPDWLNDLAEKNSINFSQTLQKALKQQLGIE